MSLSESAPTDSRGRQAPRWVVGVDVGGTFTDFYAEEPGSGRFYVGKRPSTPGNPAEAILQGMQEMANRHQITLEHVTRLSHGTTVATNALIQRRGGRVALITTRGFGDLLEIGRQIRPHMYAFDRDFPDPLVPRHLRFEITERVGPDAAVVTPLDETELERVVAEVGRSDVEVVAVCFLFAFLNPQHERQVADALKAAHPHLHLSLSSEVQPEFREFERFNTTVINAYLQPLMARYVGDLETGVRQRLGNTPVGINQSSGGLMSPARARALPVRTALSGPAAGVVGALAVAQDAKRSNVISLDVGGTSADVALIRNLQAEIAFDRSVADFPIRLPMVDIHTIGAGGGSLAWFDRDGLMKVGPHSAGADPGPACYALGGTEPTVSDANLLLGRLSPILAGGAMELDCDLAYQAVAKVAQRLGLSPERTACGIVEIAVSNMVRAIRTISVERGHDPREFALMAFGGAGPLHAREVAASLGMAEILVPAVPGIVCAQGLIRSDLKEDFVASERMVLEPNTQVRLAALLGTLRHAADQWFVSEEIPMPERRMEASLDMRYVGQYFALAVPLDSADAMPDPEILRSRFFGVHDHAYGYHNPADPIEAINLRLTARGALSARSADIAYPRDPGRPVGERRVWFTPDESTMTPIYRREDLAPGQTLKGPVVVEQLDATTPLWPEDRLQVLDSGALVIALGVIASGGPT